MISGAALLEQAVHLCRSERGGAMIAYWIGTAPFVTAVLFFCQAITVGGDASELTLPFSLLLSVLWLWMNFWHTVCCDGLWRSVSEDPGPGWTWRSAARALLTNAALQGPGIPVLAIAAMLTLPFPWAHAFLQNCHVYASRGDLGETSRKAAQQAALWPKQNWQLLCCVLLLAVILFVNLMIAMYMGAQVLNGVFGIRTALTQTRMAILSPPYLMTAACFTFLALDPVWKAAHVVRCFHGESTRTGADLRLALRRLAVGLALVVIAAAPAAAQTPPSTQKYDRAIKQVLERPEYEWTARGQTARQPTDPALLRQLDRFRVWIDKGLQWLEEWLRKMSTEKREGSEGAGPATGLRWAALGAVVLCVIVICVLAIRSRGARSRKAVIADSVPVAEKIDITDDSITPDRLPADEWLLMADGFLRNGDTRLATRAVYLAALSRLESERLLILGRHKTNLEYEGELARRARTNPVAGIAFRAIADAFERSWYGRHALDEQSVLALKTSLGSLRLHA